MAATPAAQGTLHRSLGPLGVILLAVSMTSPAGSVMVAGADILHQTGGGTIAAFLIATPIVLCASLLYAELYSAFPHAGGLYSIVGRLMGPSIGIVMLALCVAGTPAFVAMFALGVLPYLKIVWPSLMDIPVAIAIVVLATSVALFNIRTSAWITGVFLAVEVIVVLTVTILGALHPMRGAGAAIALPTANGTLWDAGTLGMAIVAAYWSISGGAQAVYFSEEMKKPRQLGWVIIAAALVIAALELGPVASLLIGAKSPAVLSSPSPFMAFVAQSLPAALARAFGLGVAAALLNAVIAMVVAYARVVFAAGRDGIWPGAWNGPAAAIHPKTGAPWIATLAIGAISAGLCLLSLHALVVYSAGMSFAADIVAAFTVMSARRRGLLAHAPVRAPAVFWLCGIMMLSAVGAIAAQMADPAAGRPGLAIAACVAVASLAYYAFVLARRSERFAFIAPNFAEASVVIEPATP